MPSLSSFRASSALTLDLGWSLAEGRWLLWCGCVVAADFRFDCGQTPREVPSAQGTTLGARKNYFEVTSLVFP